MQLKFVIDEDMPRSTAKFLNAIEQTALDIRDHGLRGAKDNDIFEFSQKETAILVTGDLGFGNILQFPPGSHHGILIAHFPNEMPPKEINEQIENALKTLSENDLSGNLVIIEPGKIRIRRKS